MLSQFINCPPGKDINSHFKDQLTQLHIKPQSREDAYELMQILNSYLGYPDSQLANCHRNANKLGLLDLKCQQRLKISQNQPLDEQFMKNIRESLVLKVISRTCHCCGFIIQQNNIATCSPDLKNINNLGTATLAFFRTFMHIGILFLVMAVVYSGYAFITNIILSQYSTYCNSLDLCFCISLGVKLKIEKDDSHNQERSQYYYISCWLGLLMLVVWWFLFIIQKRKSGKIENDSNRSLGISDYSVVIVNMPVGFTQEQIEQQFNDHLNMLKIENDSIHLDQIKVVKFNEGKPFYLNQSEFKDQELVEIHKSNKEVKDKIAGYVEEYIKNGSFVTPDAERRCNYAKLQQLTQKKSWKYEEISNNIKAKLNSRQQISKTVVFVTFQTHQMRQFVLSQNKKSLFYRLKRLLQFRKKSTYFTVVKDDFFNQVIKIEKPPQPEDIIWGNLGFSFCQKFKLRCITLLSTIIIIGIGVAFMYGLKEDQNLRDTEREPFISHLITLIIILINLALQMLIRYMTVLEKDYSISNFQISIAVKTVIAQVANQIIATLIIDINIRYGLAEDVFTLAIYNSLLPPLFKLIDPPYIFQRLKYKYYSNEVRRLRLTQFQLTKMSERMQFQIGMEYIYMISNYLFICFYAPLQPIICLFAILGLLLMYWVQKYSLLSRCQRPVPGPDVITSAMYQLLYLGPIFFALGNLLWSWYLNGTGFQSSIGINFVSLFLAIAIFIFPYDRCLPQVQKRENKTYHQRKIFFPSEYDRLNPSTSRKAIEQYRKFLEEKKAELQLAGNARLSQQVFNQLTLMQQKNIYKSNIKSRFTQNEQDFVIQQIFNNESRNVINPGVLLSKLFPQISNEEQQLHHGNQRAWRRQLHDEDDCNILFGDILLTPSQTNQKISQNSKKRMG